MDTRTMKTILEIGETVLRSNSKDVEMECKVMYTKQYARF